MSGLIVTLPRLFLRQLRRFRQRTGNRMFVLVALTTLMSWSEGLGIALVFPLFGSDGAADSLSRALPRLFAALHVPLTPTGALPVLIAAFVAKGLLQFATQCYEGHLAAQLGLGLRRDLVRGLRGLEQRAALEKSAGVESNLVATEVPRVGLAFTYFLRTFPPAMNVLVFLAIVLLLDWRLTCLCLAMGLVVIATLAVTGRIAARESTVLARESSLLSRLLVETMHAFKYLRATGRFGVVERQIGAAAERAAQADTRARAAEALSMALPQPLMVIFLAALLYHRATIQHLPFGSLFVLLIYFVRVMSELWTLQFYWQTFLGFLGSVDVVSAALDSLAVTHARGGALPYVAGPTAIELRDVSFAYVAERPVLRRVSLSIAPASTVALVGQSGAGKTTLVDVMLGTLAPTGGSVAINGVRLEELDLETLRRAIGYVPQDALLFDDTIGNNITLWTPTPDDALREAARRAGCLELIDAMPQGFATPVGDRGVKLSGGQRQRVAIARELLRRPAILVLDEATSSLDAESERAIRESIAALRGQMTIVVIAHRLSTIRGYDHVCVLHEGRIVEEGAYAELLARAGSRFAELCRLQELPRDDAAPSLALARKN
jgi:subfamily B ATP-binding cassette protein MsbA